MIGLCTESSHINPILGPELLLSLPSCISAFLSLSLSSFLLLPIFIGLPSFFFLHIGLGLIFVSLQCFLSYLANHSTLQISHWLNFFPQYFWQVKCDRLPLYPYSAPLTPTGVKCHYSKKTRAHNRKSWRWHCMYLCHGRVRRDWSERDLSQWVFRWNREPFRGQQGLIPTLLLLTTPMSTAEAEEVKYV